MTKRKIDDIYRKELLEKGYIVSSLPSRDVLYIEGGELYTLEKDGVLLEDIAFLRSEGLEFDFFRYRRYAEDGKTILYQYKETCDGLDVSKNKGVYFEDGKIKHLTDSVSSCNSSKSSKRSLVFDKEGDIKFFAHTIIGKDGGVLKSKTSYRKGLKNIDDLERKDLLLEYSELTTTFDNKNERVWAFFDHSKGRGPVCSVNIGLKNGKVTYRCHGKKQFGDLDPESPLRASPFFNKISVVECGLHNRPLFAERVSNEVLNKPEGPLT
jgi:hypothetical protein